MKMRIPAIFYYSLDSALLNLYRLKHGGIERDIPNRDHTIIWQMAGNPLKYLLRMGEEM